MFNSHLWKPSCQPASNIISDHTHLLLADFPACFLSLSYCIFYIRPERERHRATSLLLVLSSSQCICSLFFLKTELTLRPCYTYFLLRVSHFSPSQLTSTAETEQICIGREDFLPREPPEFPSWYFSFLLSLNSVLLSFGIPGAYFNTFLSSHPNQPSNKTNCLGCLPPPAPPAIIIMLCFHFPSAGKRAGSNIINLRCLRQWMSDNIRHGEEISTPMSRGRS